MNRLFRALWNDLSPTRKTEETEAGNGVAAKAGDAASLRRGIRRPRPAMLAMEARLMFDGAAVDTAVAAAADTAGSNTLADQPDPLAVPPAVDAAAAASQRNEIVFVESNIADYQTLVNSVSPGASVYVLDASRDGLTQIAQILEGRSGIDAIHILSHGSEAALGLGSLSLSMANLQGHASELAAIGSRLSPQGDILLYGCNVSAGADGGAFISAMANLTGADVAASTNATGAAAKSGDWVLESATGMIEAAAFTAVEYGDIFTDPGVDSPTIDEDTDSGPIAITQSDNLETHYKITGITGGTLYSDAGYTTQINDGDFIACAGATTNVYFRPTAERNTTTGGNGSFVLQASSSNNPDNSGLVGSQVTSTITLTPVADTPSVASPTVNEDTDSGAIAITRSAVDGAETTHYQITGITGGTLYSDAGYTTQINNGDFIASGGATTNVYFRPTANRNSTTGGDG
ncbi:MAG: DUF4347 domain-containing protein, partial [Sterolibacteriaceae bacterium MAG5]|nr:DUF4347 domain-containing protein [Candidatus Nitricoxidireducens bremensis]